MSSSSSGAKEIVGTYDLYNEEDQVLKAQLEILSADGEMFTVRGIGQSWAGVGKFDGQRGFYHWQFTSGEKGLTTIELVSIGRIRGHVEGAGPGLNWRFIGIRK